MSNKNMIRSIQFIFYFVLIVQLELSAQANIIEGNWFYLDEDSSYVEMYFKYGKTLQWRENIGPGFMYDYLSICSDSLHLINQNGKYTPYNVMRRENSLLLIGEERTFRLHSLNEEYLDFFMLPNTYEAIDEFERGLKERSAKFKYGVLHDYRSNRFIGNWNFIDSDSSYTEVYLRDSLVIIRTRKNHDSLGLITVKDDFYLYSNGKLSSKYRLFVQGDDLYLEIDGNKYKLHFIDKYFEFNEYKTQLEANQSYNNFIQREDGYLNRR